MIIRVTLRNTDTSGTTVYCGANVAIVGPMLLLDGRQIARKWEAVDSPWLDSHGRAWDRIDIEVGP